MKVARILGIDIFINFSWLFVFALVVWSLAGNIGPLHALKLAPVARAFLAIVTASLFFLSVLVHELTHALVARRSGIPIRGITLFIFGGVSLLDFEPTAPPREVWLAAVGPLTSVTLGVAFAALAQRVSIPPHHLITAVHDWRGGFTLVFDCLARSNYALALFNLLPAYPLDGGRVLHALIWRSTGDQHQATSYTVIVGRSIAACFLALGIYWTVTDGFGLGFWLTLLGWFLLQAGEAERVVARVTEALRGHQAAELAQPPAVQVRADQTAATALNDLLNAHVHAAPVFVGERLIGIVTLQSLVRVADPAVAYVTTAMTKITEVTTISGDCEAVDVTRQFAHGGPPLLPVLDVDGEVLGFITREIVLSWMMKDPLVEAPL